MDIRFEEFKDDLNLTQTLLFSASKPAYAVTKIIDIQSKIVKGFERDFKKNEVRHIKSPASLQRWGKNPEGRRLYAYRSDTFHYSVLNCCTVKLGTHDFERQKAAVEGERWFQLLRDFNCKYLVKSKPEAIKIGGIYCQLSVALKVYPLRGSWFEGLREWNRVLQKTYRGFVSPRITPFWMKRRG